MRKIKFRAWYKHDSPPLMFVQKTVEGESCEMVMVSDENYKHTIDVVMCDSDWILEQFTGLFDKHGKEIYEGDIIYEECSEYRLEIRYAIGAFLPYFANGNEYEALEYLNLTDNYEVIGNIHENPELLK